MAVPQQELTEDVQGGSGVLVFNGLYTDRDKVSEFKRGRQWGTHTTYGDLDTMLATDSILHLGVDLITESIIAASHNIVASRDTTPEMQELVERQLFDTLDQDYFNFVRQALQSIWWGSHLFEEEWVADGGEIRLVRFHARMPWTVWQWDVENGRLNGIKQQTMRDGQWGFYTISSNRLTTFVHNQQADDFRGVPLGRRFHPLWRSKQELMKDRFIGHNRNASGVPYTENTRKESDPPLSQADQDQILDFLRHVRVHEQSYLELPPGIRPEWFINDKWAAQAAEIREDINQINGEMLMGFKAPLMGMGMIGQGSRAAGDVQIEPWYLGLEAKARMLSIGMNGTGRGDRFAGPIQRMVDVNFPGFGESRTGRRRTYPSLQISGLRTRKLAEVFDSLGKAAQAGIPIYEQAADVAYNLLGIELPEPEKRKALDAPAPKTMEPQRTPANDDAEPMRAEASRTIALARGFQPSRELMPIERHVSLAKIDNRLNTGIAEYEAVVRRAIGDHAERIADAGSESAQALRGAVQAMGEDLGARLDALAEDIATFGYAQVQSERERQRSGGFEDAQRAATETQQTQVQERLEAQAIEGASIPTDDLDEGLTRRLEGQLDDAVEAARSQVEGAVQTTASEMRAQRGSFSTLTSRIEAAVMALPESTVRRGGYGFTVTAFQTGRETFAEEFRSEIQRVIISEVLDTQTCDSCAGHDGLEVDFGSAEHEAHKPPYVECEGGPRCRGIEIFDFSTEGSNG